MDSVIQYLEPLLRWFHIFFGILWIGLLYFFNWVNGPFTATMDAETKKKVIPELAPRALFWFRWGAAYTWILGILLIGLVYEYQNAAVGDASKWTGGNHALFYSFLIVPFIYDFLCKMIKDQKMLAGVGFVLIVGLVWLMQCCDFAYRGYVMYTGAMFGSMMAYNVWFRIWPSQKIIINGFKTGVPADPSVV
ncbi:MAG: urate hydroxylase PuuD, partial [Ignavibacteriota bacterium]